MVHVHGPPSAHPLSAYHSEVSVLVKQDGREALSVSHVRTQTEGGCLPARKRSVIRNSVSYTLGHRNRVPPALGSAVCLLQFEESLDSQVGQPFSPMMFPLWGWLVSKSAPRGVSEASCLLSEGPALNEARDDTAGDL